MSTWDERKVFIHIILSLNVITAARTPSVPQIIERISTMIKIEHLVKNYGTNCAVDDISFEISRGEVVGFLGPNGAGKSTTMNILTGYLSSTAGTVTIGGIDVLDNPLSAKKLIGYLPEQPPLYLDMTVEEYLNFNYELKGCKLDRAKHLQEIGRAHV